MTDANAEGSAQGSTAAAGCEVGGKDDEKAGSELGVGDACRSGDPAERRGEAIIDVQFVAISRLSIL